MAKLELKDMDSPFSSCTLDGHMMRPELVIADYAFCSNPAVSSQFDDPPRFFKAIDNTDLTRALVGKMDIVLCTCGGTAKEVRACLNDKTGKSRIEEETQQCARRGLVRLEDLSLSMEK